MIAAVAVMVHAAPDANVIALPAVIVLAPAAATVKSVVVTVCPVSPDTQLYGPEGLVIVYLGIASVADPPGIRTVSTDPAQIVVIPDFIARGFLGVLIC